MRSSRNIGTFSWALSEFIPFNRRLLWFTFSVPVVLLWTRFKRILLHLLFRRNHPC
jgi:hypothetical protein